jgi:hypothetical protein
MTDAQPRHRIDRLLDAIELVEADRRAEARDVLRELIREDGDFEYAWLWMSVAVDNIDQSSVCLDNVLRVNPANHQAAGALQRLRAPEYEMHQRRSRTAFYRDASFLLLWGFIVLMLFFMTTLVFSGGLLPG